MTAAPPVATTATDAPRRRNPFGLAVVIIGCVLVAAMWMYYLAADDGPGVYQLQDQTWRESAAPVCEQAYVDRMALVDTSQGFITDPTPEQMAVRAEIVDRATDVVETMLTDIVAIPVDNDRDREILATFEKYYRMIIADRRRYADQLRAGDAETFAESVVLGGPVSNVVTDFTAGVKGNDVPACTPPHDLANTRQP
ncbi:MAG: hypothetical protein ACO3C1_12925 [Ilumatobacteraceae bacterium]